MSFTRAQQRGLLIVATVFLIVMLLRVFGS
jgi:hypothetical protein